MANAEIASFDNFLLLSVSSVAEASESVNMWKRVKALITSLHTINVHNIYLKSNIWEKNNK